MAVRLQLKLGIVAEHDRLDDSPDTLVVVEPSVGSVARSKGHLYLLVTSRVVTRHSLEATRWRLDDPQRVLLRQMAGIRVCLQKAISTANKRLAHQADRLGLKTTDGNGPIGIGVAVVRGNEMYVATVGPAEAYLIRQARLSTLPDPHRERGLPSADLEPDVWRGEVSVGDSPCSFHPTSAKLGADELKDAMLTLHPQSAMEHLHHRFVAADGSGSDGAIAFEATEVSSTARGRTLVPVRPSAPLAGAPDRSPIPLADSIRVAGVVSAAAVAPGWPQARLERAMAWARSDAATPTRLPPGRAQPAARPGGGRHNGPALVMGRLDRGLRVQRQRVARRGDLAVNAGQQAVEQARRRSREVSGPGSARRRRSRPGARAPADAYQRVQLAGRPTSPTAGHPFARRPSRAWTACTGSSRFAARRCSRSSRRKVASRSSSVP
jgi:hypothetical protein